MGGQVAYFSDNGDVQVTQGDRRRSRSTSSSPLRWSANAEEAEILRQGRRRSGWLLEPAGRRHGYWGDADIYPRHVRGHHHHQQQVLRDQATTGAGWSWRAAQDGLTSSASRPSFVLVRPDSDTRVTQDPYVRSGQVASKPRPTMSLHEGRGSRRGPTHECEHRVRAIALSLPPRAPTGGSPSTSATTTSSVVR